MADEVPPQLATIEAKVLDIFKELSTGFQKLDKIKDGVKQGKQLDELTGKMREAKRACPSIPRDIPGSFSSSPPGNALGLIKDFDKEVKDGEPKNVPDLQKLLIGKKHALIRELNTYVALRKTFTSSIGSKTDLLEGGSQGAVAGPDGARMASTMSNQELIQTGRKQMDETDRTIERSKKVVEDTMHIGAETAVTLKAQTEQLGRIVNELDTIQFSIKKASQLVREVGKQLATDKCIMCFLMLIVVGIITVIVVKAQTVSTLFNIRQPLSGAIKSNGERWQLVNAMHHEACSSEDQGHPSDSRNFSNVKAASTATVVVGYGPLIEPYVLFATQSSCRKRLCYTE